MRPISKYNNPRKRKLAVCITLLLVKKKRKRKKRAGDCQKPERNPQTRSWRRRSRRDAASPHPSSSCEPSALPSDRRFPESPSPALSSSGGLRRPRGMSRPGRRRPPAPVTRLSTILLLTGAIDPPRRPSSWTAATTSTGSLSWSSRRTPSPRRTR